MLSYFTLYSSAYPYFLHTISITTFANNTALLCDESEIKFHRKCIRAGEYNHNY